MEQLTDSFQIFIMFMLEWLIIPALVSFLSYHAGLAALRLNKFIQEKLDEQMLKRLQAVVEIGVKAAEQAGLKGAIQNIGEEKKQFAIREIQRMLDERGLTKISMATISTMIEAALRDGVHKDIVIEDAA